MTYEEAIKRLSEIKGNPTILQPAMRYREPLDMAIKELKKQIPKKPKIAEKYEGLLLSYNCPVCNYYFGQRGKHDVILFRKPKYCDCGQRIDFEEA